MIYKKTNSGAHEIENPGRVLNHKERQVLIMINGNRNEQELASLLGRLDVPGIIKKLLDLGYIYEPGSIEENIRSTPFENKPEQPSPAVPYENKVSMVDERHIEIPPIETSIRPEINDEQFSAVKTLLTVSTEKHLGILGRSLLLHIQAANTHEELEDCIPRWHMAMRESKSGKAQTSILIEMINSLMVSERIES